MKLLSSELRGFQGEMCFADVVGEGMNNVGGGETDLLSGEVDEQFGVISLFLGVKGALIRSH